VAKHGRSGDSGWLLWLTMLWTYLWGLVAVLALVDLVAAWTGLATAGGAAGSLEAALITGIMAALGVFRLRWLVVRDRLRDRPAVGSGDPPALDSVAPPWSRIEKHHRLPRPKSVARAPMRRLASAESTLAELMRQLSDAPDGSALPSGTLEQAWRIAAGAAAELRAVAARLEAVEFAAEQALPHERGELEAGVRRLRAHIDRGLDGYRSLIAAAGRVLIASATTPAGAELIEATEQLAGLAQALHELSGDYDR
jgi:hypothetical protein